MPPPDQQFLLAIRECREISFEYFRQSLPVGWEVREGIPLDYGPYDGSADDRYHIWLYKDGSGHLAGISADLVRSMRALTTHFDSAPFVSDLLDPPFVARFWPCGDPRL